MSATVESIAGPEDFSFHDWSNADKFADQMQKHKISRRNDLWSRIAEGKRRD